MLGIEVGSVKPESQQEGGDTEAIGEVGKDVTMSISSLILSLALGS